MVKVIGILMIAAIILVIEVPSLKKKKQKKELVVFSLLLTIGVGLSIAYTFGKTIPNPMDLLNIVYKPINDFFVG